MLDQRQRLRIVHNDEVVVEKIAHTVLVNHLFENFLFDAGEIDPGALERVVDFLCDREEIGGALDALFHGSDLATLSEVNDLHPAFLRAQDVVGLDVAVCITHLVHRL